MKSTFAIVLASVSLLALPSCMETLNSVASAAGSAGMGGGGGYSGGQARGYGYGASPSPYGQQAQQQAGYRSSPYGQQSRQPSILGGGGFGQATRGGYQSAPQGRSSLPPGFANEVRSLDYKSDDLLKEIRKFAASKTSGLSVSGGFASLLKAGEALEKELDDYENVVGKKRGIEDVARKLTQAMEASSAVKLRMQRLKSTPASVKSLHSQIDRELKDHYRMIGG